MSTSYVNGADWVTFAAFIMVAAGFARIISSITYFGNSHQVANLTGGLPGGSRRLRAGEVAERIGGVR